MKVFLYVMLAATVALVPIVSPGISARPRKVLSAQPASVEDILMAHGGRFAVSAIDSYRLEMTKIVNTDPPGFFARRVRLSVEGDKILRQTSGAFLSAPNFELFDYSGKFHAFEVNHQEEGTALTGPLPSDAQRQSVVRANVAVCSLIPFLKVFSDPASKASYLGREKRGLDKYLITAPGREFVIHLDHNRLISRIEVGELRFEFAEFRQVGALRLPFFERISRGDRPVFDFFFSEFEINPTFPSGYFSRAAVES